MKWLQVVLQLSPELAEPVAELISRYAEGGVAVTSFPPDESIYKTEEVRVFGYLPAGPALADQRRLLEEGLWHLSQIEPLPEPDFEWVEEVYWALSWRFNYHPLTVGQRFLIQPAWLEPKPTDRLVLRMNPGMAFGTGAHPTTQLCIELIERHLKPGQTMADLGAGSGILSVAGALLGAEQVLAFDTSNEAVTAARRNSALNQVAARVECRKGSLAQLLAAIESGFAPDLIAVNILADIIMDFLTAGLSEALPPDSRLILGGILQERAEAVLDVARDHGLRLIERHARDDWVAYALNQNPSR